MDTDHFELVADVLSRKLPRAEILPGEHQLAGTALVDLDVTIAKSAPTERLPNLPWKSMFAALTRELAYLGTDADVIAAKACRKAVNSEKDIPLLASVEQALEKIREKLPPKPAEGPTKITGTVEVIGFAPATLTLPGLADMKRAIAATRRAA